MASWLKKFKNAIRKSSAKGYQNYKKSQSKKKKNNVRTSYGELVKSTQKKSTPKKTNSTASRGNSNKSSGGAAKAKVSVAKKKQREAEERKRREQQAKKAVESSKNALNALVKTTKEQKNKKLSDLAHGGAIANSYKNSNKNVYKPIKNVDQTKKIQKQNAETRAKKRDSDIKKAIKIAKNTDALGVRTDTKEYKETHSYKKDNERERELARASEYAKSVAYVTNELAKEEYKGLSNKQKNKLAQEYIAESKKQIDSAIKEAYKNKENYKNLTLDEHLRFQNATRTAGGNARMAGNALNEDIKEKLAKQYSANYKKAKNRTGFIEGAAPIDVQNYTRNLTRDKDGNSRLDEKTIQQAENTLGYKLSNMAGFIAGSLTSGVGSAPEKALGTGIGKLLAKGGAKSSAKKGVKKFAADRAADLIISTPYDAVDSLKGAVDEKGNVDWKQAAKNMGVNAVGNVALGGALDLAGKGISKISQKEAREALKIKAKQNVGVPLTKSEEEFYNKTMSKARTTAIDNAEKKAVEEVRTKNMKKYSLKDGAVEAYRNADAKTIGKDDTTSSYVKTDDVPLNLKSTYNEYINSTNLEVKQGIENLRNGKPAGKKSFNLGDVNSKETGIISKELGINVSNYKHTVEADRLIHIDNRHGIVGSANQNMANANDIARMGHVIEKADSIEIVKDFDTQYRDSKGNPVPVAIYRKRINGDVAVVEAIPDAKAKELRVVSTYFETIKKSDSKVTDVNSPVFTSKNEARLTLSNNSIYKSKEDVNVQKVNDESIVENSRLLETEAKKIEPKAVKLQTELDNTLKSIGDEMGVDIEVGKPKTIDSMLNKVMRKQEAGEDYNLYSMKDHARNKVELNSYDDIPTFLNKLDEKGVNYETEIVQTDMGYKGFHVTYRNNDGLGAEIQLTTKDAWKAKLESDKLYDKWRNVNINTLPKKEFDRYMEDVHKSYQLWDSVDTSSLGKLDISSLDSGRPVIMSPKNNARGGLTQAPSTSSKNGVGKDSVFTTTRPDSVTTYRIDSPPNKSNNSLYDLEGKSNSTDNIEKGSIQKANDESILEHIKTSELDENFKAFKSTVNDMRKDGISDMELIDNLRLMGASDEQIDTVLKEPVSKAEKEIKAQIEKDPKAQEKWNEEVKSIEYIETFDNIGENIKAENPSPQDALKRAAKFNKLEARRIKQTAEKFYKQADDDIADIMEPWIKEGRFTKKIREAQNEAIERAKKELEEKTLYTNFMNSRPEDNEHIFMARGKVLLEEFFKEAPKGYEAAELLGRVMDKITDASSFAGRLLNATKLVLRSTPEGRLRIIQKEVNKLNKKYGDRIKEGKIELTDEQISRILKATDDEIVEVMDKVNIEVWDKIPATLFEKLNEWRHCSMLFNIKTHGRNVIGNLVFRGARTLSNCIEIGLNKMAKNKIEKLGGKVDMVKVTHEDMKKHSKELNVVFLENYSKSGSKGQYIERIRPDGSVIFKAKWLNKVTKFGYDALEWEDVKFALGAEYKKSYMRWCKSRGIDDLTNMTAKEKLEANLYAMNKAEVATFRDTSKVSEILVRLKNTTATKQGRGKLLYRAGNVALESLIPFVKTPINIFRRSVDYSPLGLLKSVNRICRTTDPEEFKEGIHYMATGLTGTGVFSLGVFLASKDLVTVQLGDVSGDEYYDRDMGYQDYSLKINIGGREYSASLDWLAPNQVSLFMGAQAYNMMSKDGLTAMDMFNGVLATINPTLDMSYMSATKDTLDMIAQSFYGDGMTPAEVIIQTLGGTIPQNYLSGFVPQIVKQAAGLDKYQRDTRSTSDGILTKSWESWGKRQMNEIPGLRQMLNVKRDRRGEPVKSTGDNIVTRAVHSFASPSNIKEIHLTKEDKWFINDVLNKIEKDEDKKRLLYNLTGNPNYDLGDGKRMTYEELGKYGKVSRQYQWGMITELANSKREKGMTINMKVSELKTASFLSNNKADLKVYGEDFAYKRIMADEHTSKPDKVALEYAIKGGKSKKEAVEFFIKKEKFLAQAHDKEYTTKAMAAALFGDDTWSKLYKCTDDKIKKAKKYIEKCGKKNAQEKYINSMCNVVAALNSVDASTKKSNKAIEAVKFEIDKDTCGVMGITPEMANMGYGIIKFGYSYEALNQIEADGMFSTYDKDGNLSLNKKELTRYIRSLGLGREESAVLFAYFSDSNNPFGNVPDYLKWGYSAKNGGGRRYYGYSKSRRGRSGGGSSKAAKPNMPSWESFLKDYLTHMNDVDGVNFKNWDSPLDAAYRNKINAILKKTKVKQ